MSSSLTPRFYTVQEVAQITQIAVPTLYRAIRRGDIPTLKIGRAVRIPAAWVDAWTQGMQPPRP